jgi:hypothetical protein
MLQHQKITLVFPSLNQLWGFVREAKINYIECITDSFTLVCNCHQNEIDQAKESYGAIVVA